MYRYYMSLFFFSQFNTNIYLALWNFNRKGNCTEGLIRYWPDPGRFCSSLECRRAKKKKKKKKTEDTNSRDDNYDLKYVGFFFFIYFFPYFVISPCPVKYVAVLKRSVFLTKHMGFLIRLTGYHQHRIIRYKTKYCDLFFFFFLKKKSR